MYCSFFTGTVYGYPTVGMMSLGPAVAPAAFFPYAVVLLRCLAPAAGLLLG